MTIFLILAPYGAFTLLMLVTSPTVSLFAAASLCLVSIAFDVVRGRSIKMLGAGSAVIFTALGCCLACDATALSCLTVKIAVETGLFVIGLVSLAIRRPFTLQYAREMVDAETAQLPDFLAANYIITSVWVLAFLLMMSTDALLIYLPSLPLWLGLAIAFAARNTAVFFSRWYPSWRRQKSTSSLAAAATPAH